MKAKSAIILAVTAVLIIAVGFLAINGLTIGDVVISPVADAISLGLDLRGGIYAVYVATDTEQEDFETLLQGTISVLRSRLDAQGFTEATVTRQGTNRIRVEIPDVSDPNSILDIIGTPAHLEFLDPEGNVVIEGKDIKSARAVYYEDNRSQPVVQFELNDSGREAFATATSENIGNVIAIVLDGTYISTPIVQSAITDGAGIIDGMEDDEAAVNLAMLIMSGALPLDIEQDEVNAVSATLGVEALETSIKAGIIGVILVMLFMLAVYRLPGLIADMALCIYILIVLYCVALVPGVQLTLPGIAGILLGIGMAVDANVIIFERFREELKDGSALQTALRRGYKSALTAVIDSNVTTIIAALVLMYFGTGTIKGFATTLLIGIIASMITAIFITRALLKSAIRLGDGKKLALYTR
ncbi:MAG: protein translocase subunit SecD [Clostridia bacterium]|nr:protein translocase subunit SecD [Clostridia bacterium]